uniref:Integrase catalytic domain-containing protein n=1 Tax=Phlebotomus papatasi TaxID=29031 RepID=A0A1B0DFG5_PHLPP
GSVNLLKAKNIKQYFSYNPTLKCAVVERFNRTLKQLMYRYFTHTNSLRYIDVLQDLVSSYNNKIHSTIKMKPADVSDDHITKLNEIYKKRHDKIIIGTKKKPPFALYILRDYKNKQITGRFYANQLQKIQNDIPPIEKIIKTRGLGKNLQYLVKFSGNVSNKWIDKKEILKQYGINGSSG